jgi:hypothetical protein
MDTDRNLLFGVLALQADLIDPQQFIEACVLWTGRKHVPLADLLVERGWIMPEDLAHMDYLLTRKLHKHGGDARAGLVAMPDDVKRSLAALEDDDIQRSLADLPVPGAAAHQLATVDQVPGPRERYARLRLHATGGIGRVWLAHDGDLGRDVALKELKSGSPFLQADSKKVRVGPRDQRVLMSLSRRRGSWLSTTQSSRCLPVPAGSMGRQTALL